MPDSFRISNDEYAHVISISRAIQNARRGRDGKSRERIALTLLTFACALVDDDVDGSRALMQAASKLVERMKEQIILSS